MQNLIPRGKIDGERKFHGQRVPPTVRPMICR
jgi:hypothetical protein